MLISVLTSSLLSKVQFHMRSFPRSNCQFLEHRHFTTQEREENNCRFLTLQFAPSWQKGQERLCLQTYDFRGRPHFLQRLVFTLSECYIWIAFLVAPPVSWSVCFKNSCGELIFLLCLLLSKCTAWMQHCLCTDVLFMQNTLLNFAALCSFSCKGCLLT